MLIDGLPTVLIEKILLNLAEHPRDLVNFSLSSKVLNDVALSDVFWLRVLIDRWGDRTQPSEWLTEIPLGHFERLNSRHGFPGTYRALYPILRDYERIVGVWTDADRSNVCVFGWRPDCIEGSCLDFQSMTESSPDRIALARLSGDGTAGVDFVDDRHCWLKEFNVLDGRLTRSPCSNAEAAASVAVGRHGGGESSKLLGSSPQGSFEHEMLRFMQMHVSRSRRKSRSKSPSHGGHLDTKARYHLKRVPLSVPTRAHPLNGIWKGDFLGPTGVQIVSVGMDFSRHSAAIRAVRVTSKLDAYHSQHLWSVTAQPAPLPFSRVEAALIDLRPAFLSTAPDYAPPLDPLAEDEDTKVVVGSYKGKGRMSNTQDFYEGRLWHYSDGSIGFLWLIPDFAHGGQNFGQIVTVMDVILCEEQLIYIICRG